MNEITSDAVISALEQGTLDDHAKLREIIRYAEWRLKVVSYDSGLRKGARVRISPLAGSDLGGREARIKRVNKKSVTLVLLDNQGNETWAEWRVGPSLVEAI
jgi:hypothetical protein